MIAYSLANEDLRAAMHATRNDPKAGFMALAYNRMMADDAMRSAQRRQHPTEQGDHLYGVAMLRAVDRAGNRMYRQCETPESTRGREPQLGKAYRRGTLFMTVEFAGFRFVLDLKRIPEELKKALPANWPAADGVAFAPFMAACLTHQPIADALIRLGVLEAL